MAAERGNTVFWDLLSARADLDPLCLDMEGNTPLMTAVAAGQPDIVLSWINNINSAGDVTSMLTIQNSAGLNLFMLVIKNLTGIVIEKFINAVDLTVCIDQKDKEGTNALLQLCILEKWSPVKQLLSNPNIDEIAMDVHPTDKLGSSALVLVLVAKTQAERQAQNFKVKNDSQNEKMYQREADRLWSIVELLVTKERDLHGMNLTTGRDAGVKCIKQQLECNRKIRTPVPEEVLQEFTKLYNVVFKAKKKPVPPPEVKVQPKKPQVSSFQEKMNNIYKDANKDERTQILDSLKLERATKIEKVKPNYNDLEWECDDEPILNKIKNNNDIEKDNGIKKHLVKPIEIEESPPKDNEPSVDEIRALWKQNRNKNKEIETKKEEFNSSDYFDSLLKKHEKTTGPERPVDIEDQELAERMNEEIVWALQQKQEAELAARPVTPPPKKLSADALKTQEILRVKEEMRKNEQKRAEEMRINEQKRAEKAAPAKIKKKELNFMDLVDKPRKVNPKVLKAQEEKEIQELENAINEEIRWAMEEKKRIEDERNIKLGITVQPKQVKNTIEVVETKPKPNEVDMSKNEEDRKRKMSEERQRLERLQREAEEMIRKAKQTQIVKKPEEVKEEEDLINDGISEEMQWVLEEKARAEKEAAKALLEREESEKKQKEEERQRKNKEEHQRLERIQREAEEMIRKAKEQLKVKKPEETKEQEQPINNGTSKQIQPALDEKTTIEENKNKTKLKRSESIKESKEEKFSPLQLKSAKDRDTNKPMTIQEKIEIQKKKEEERLKKFKEEKERIANLQNAVKSKIKSERASIEPSYSEPKEEEVNGKEESKSINGIEIIDNQKEETSGLTNIPQWKRDKMLREKSKSVDSNGFHKSDVQERKSSLNSPTQQGSPKSPVILGEEIEKLPRWKREKILR